MHPGVDLIEASNLWNGKFTARFRVPWDTRPGDVTRIRLTVSDVERVAKGPFVTEFELVAGPAAPPQPPGPKPDPPKVPSSDDPEEPRGQLPTPTPVRKDQWGQGTGINGANDAFRIKQAPTGGYDFFYNEDCHWLVREKAEPGNDPARVTHWFSWGLALAAIGMIRRAEATGSTPTQMDSCEEGGLDLEAIAFACDGLAQVIIPMIRALYHYPPVA